MQQHFRSKSSPAAQIWTLGGRTVCSVGPVEAIDDWEEVISPAIAPTQFIAGPCTGTLKRYQLYLSKGHSGEKAAELSNYCP